MIECLPIDDIKEHGIGSVCDCEPKVIFANGEMIVVHNAFDGRHIIEEVNEIIGCENTNGKWVVIENR